MAYTPTIDRTALLSGPAHIIYSKPAAKADWKYCWCRGDVTVTLARTPIDMPVAGFGAIDDPAADETIEVEFTPAGNFSADLFAWLYGGIFSSKPGDSLFGAEDSPVWIHTLDGQIMQVSNARVTQFPALQFGAGLARFSGSAKLTGVVRRAMARTADGALFTAPAPEAFTASPGPGEWAHLPCLATWSLASPLAIMTDSSGWTLRAAHTLAAMTNPDVGTYDYRVTACAVEASCTPVNITDAQLLSAALAGPSRAIGSPTPSGALTLAEDHPGLTAVLYGARLASHPAVYSEAKPRAGQLTWRAYGAGTLASVAQTAQE